MAIFLNQLQRQLVFYIKSLFEGSEVKGPVFLLGDNNGG
jgi:hypothetical protein